jgi:hypothetical protein
MISADILSQYDGEGMVFRCHRIAELIRRLNDLQVRCGD